MRKGFGMIELMIIIGVIALLTASISRMIASYSTIQNMSNVSQTFESLRARIGGIVLSEQGWQAILNDPNNAAAMGCLTIGNCANGTDYGPISIVDRDGVVLFDASSATSGFTVDGLPCNTFNPAAGSGDDSCPISFAAGFPIWTANCPLGAANCGNPTITIRVQWQYNAGLQSRNLALNPARYNMSLNKSMVTSNQTFVLAEAYPNITGRGSGACGAVPNSTITRSIDTVMDDPANQIQIVGGGVFRILQAGAYRCRVTVPGYKVANFEAKLINVETGAVVALATAATFNTTLGGGGGIEYGTQSNAVIETALTINSPTRFRVDMTCAQRGVVENAGSMAGVCPHADGEIYARGLPPPAEAGSLPSTVVLCNAVNYTYSTSYLSVVSCERMN